MQPSSQFAAALPPIGVLFPQSLQLALGACSDCSAPCELESRRPESREDQPYRKTHPSPDLQETACWLRAPDQCYYLQWVLRIDCRSDTSGPFVRWTYCNLPLHRFVERP